MNKLIILIILSLIVIGCTRQLQVSINSKTFDVEIVDTTLERAEGLMFKKELKEDQGMLFIFDSSEKHSFWMKNTFLPLDIIWIDENLEIVYVHEDARPCIDQCKSIVPDKDAKYVLEINAGLVEKYNFKVEDKVEIV